MRARKSGFTLVELPAVSKRKRKAFTLVELLVVIWDYRGTARSPCCCRHWAEHARMPTAFLA